MATQTKTTTTTGPKTRKSASTAAPRKRNTSVSRTQKKKETAPEALEVLEQAVELEDEGFKMRANTAVDTFASDEEAEQALMEALILSEEVAGKSETAFGKITSVFLHNEGQLEPFMKTVEAVKESFMNSIGCKDIGLYLKPKKLSPSEWELRVSDFLAGKINLTDFNKVFPTRPDLCINYDTSPEGMDMGIRAAFEEVIDVVLYSKKGNNLYTADNPLSKTGTAALFTREHPYAKFVLPYRNKSGQWANATLFYPTPFQSAISRIKRGAELVGAEKLADQIAAGGVTSNALDALITEYRKPSDPASPITLLLRALDTLQNQYPKLDKNLAKEYREKVEHFFALHG